MNELEQLSALDPARDWEPSPARRARSTSSLENLMRAPAQPEPPGALFGSRWRITASLAAACAVVTAVVASLLPGDGDAAYASWTPVPEPLTAAEALPAAEQCAAGWSTGWEPPPAPDDVLLAERRGIATMVLIDKGADGLVACDILDPANGVSGASLLDPDSPLPAANRVTVESQLASGDTAWYSQVIGRSGPGVTDVDVILPDGTTIRATTRAGWWLAWWPGREGSGMGKELRFVVHSASGQVTYPRPD